MDPVRIGNAADAYLFSRQDLSPEPLLVSNSQESASLRLGGLAQRDARLASRY